MGKPLEKPLGKPFGKPFGMCCEALVRTGCRTRARRHASGQTSTRQAPQTYHGANATQVVFIPSELATAPVTTAAGCIVVSAGGGG